MERGNISAYLLISGVIFGLIALGHLIRVISGLALAIGQFSVPMWASYVAIVVSVVLCVWGIRLGSKYCVPT
jgi:uncharacterized protein YacL